ncbi:MAG: condensation domain-containing protein, partial [Ktedonobacteraceae bacterium]
MSNKPIEAIYPLSPLQEGLLFHTLRTPGAYHNQFICTFEGGLDVPCFQQAWQQVLHLHPVLRTAILWKRRGSPLQLVHKQLTIPWRCEDWRALTA